MSKIGTYALEVMDNEANTGYRNDYATGSDMVLRNPARGGTKAEITSQLNAARATSRRKIKRNRS